MAEDPSVSLESRKNSDEVKAADGMVVTSFEDEDSCKYGELILLGYNGSQESGRSNSHGRKHRSKMAVTKRAVGNGIKKGTSSSFNVPPRQTEAVLDSSRHVVSYSYNRTHTVLVEYVPDPAKDMFQVGRSSEEQIDFTIVDTWLAAGSNVVLSPAGNNISVQRLLRSPNGGLSGGEVIGQRPISSTISRYACRILIDRDQPHTARLYAAGFDASRNIFLGEKATKWTKKNGEVDGLTTNGILILHPHPLQEQDENTAYEDSKKMYVWREVSVDGDIYKLRETRSSTKRGDLAVGESNELQDGTLIDLCGATLLWRTAEGLSKSPSRVELEVRLDELNAGKPQCPVNLNTLIIPRKKSAKTCSSSRQPYVYLGCGHVQGKHTWGLNNVSNSPSYKCPICLVDSSKVIQLIMGMESAFHLDSGALDYAFNPCGHVCSLATVRYWSKIPLPHGTNSFHPVCPFCTSLLCMDKPYVRLIFQDHCFDS
uniref:Protein pellino n=1 Tax=Parascaris univalens TaxID=6257 RepID=A0A914ZRH2_PARUN